MNSVSGLRAALLVAGKEVRSAFRDRQTRIYTLFMPLVMYPAMFWIALQAASLVDALRTARAVAIEVHFEEGSEARARELAQQLRAADRALHSEPAAEGDGAREDESFEDEAFEDRVREDVVGDVRVDASAEEPPPSTSLELASSATDFETASTRLTARDRVDAVVWIPVSGPIVLVHDGSRSASDLARDRLEELFENLVATGRERDLGAPVESLAPYSYARVDLAAPEAVGAFLLSTMLPFMLIAMATMGAFFPAVDVTAGEKERKCAETTLLLPIPRSALFTGQLLSVATASLAATTMNLVGMTLAANHLLGLLTERIAFALPFGKVLLMLPVVLTFAIFLGAALTACASFTDTFKQGQALLGTVQTIFILPAMASTLPGIELTHQVAAVPIVGASVALREILRADGYGDLPIGPLFTALAFMAALAVVALLIAVRAMQREPGNTPRWIARLTKKKST